MMEAFFYKIPLILLPEKHHTQRICYDIFERYGLKLPTLFLSERIDRCQESKSKTDGIYTNYQNIINNQFLTNRVSKKLLNFIDIYSDEKNAKELTKSQMKFIKKYRCADLTNVVDQIINEFL